MSESVLPQDILCDYPRCADLVYAWGGTTATAIFKASPRDFVVTEVLDVDFSGQGEHLWLWIESVDMNTDYVVNVLARFFKVAKRVIGYSGKKDRRAVTRQWFSVQMPGKAGDYEAMEPPIVHENIQILRTALHHKKLRIGAHRSNRFAICLRDIQNWDEAQWTRQLADIAGSGFPNFFGPQRFGRFERNIDLAEQALMGGQRAAITDKPRKLDRKQREWVLSTLRSLEFNRFLDQREREGTAATYLPGDTLQLQGSNSFFFPERWDAALQSRLEGGDIAIAGVLPGIGELVPVTQQGQLQPVPALADYLIDQRVKQGVRPLRVYPTELEWHRDSDGNIQIAFTLPKGSYATVLLRELIHLQEASSQG